MGLDAYVFALEKKPFADVDVDAAIYKPISPEILGDTAVDYGTPEWDAMMYAEGVEQLWYFRKHHDLQGWMSIIAKERGAVMHWDSMTGSVVLTVEDLDALESSVTGRTLPVTGGFFFGSGNTEHYRDATLDMIALARERMAEGKWIVYSCSW